MTLAVRKLFVGRDGFRIGPVDFEAEDGAMVAVIGPNGSGKTTLLKTLAGLLPPLAGDLEPAAQRAAFLPPPGTIAADFTAAHLVALGRGAGRGWSPLLGAEDGEAARAALAQAGIGHASSTPFSQLSSGQQQLVLMARMLVQQAPLCLLDEPTAMLDPIQTARIDAMIEMLAEQGRIVIVSTHRLDFAARCGLVIAIGETVRVGHPGELLGREALSSVYGAEFSPCQVCGQLSVVKTEA